MVIISIKYNIKTILSFENMKKIRREARSKINSWDLKSIYKVIFISYMLI